MLPDPSALAALDDFAVEAPPLPAPALTAPPVECGVCGSLVDSGTGEPIEPIDLQEPDF